MPERRRPAPPVPVLKNKGRPPATGSTATLRVCKYHGLIEFHRYSRGPKTGGYVWRCKRCVGEAVTRRHQKIRRILLDEAGGKCVLCGYDRCVVSLHFHHVDPATKKFGVTQSRGLSLAAYQEESQKCVLVCANCHGEIEAGLIPCPPLGTGRLKA